MKADLTRNTFDPFRHFTRVIMQQGRVQLDADCNEQAAILTHNFRTLLVDLVGSAFGPAGSNGFLITPARANDFQIGAGPYYVGGIRCAVDSTPVAITGFTAGNTKQVEVANWLVDGVQFEKLQYAIVSGDSSAPFAILVQITDIDPANRLLSLDTDAGGFQNHTPQLQRITTYLTQADYPVPADEAISAGNTYQVYLDVWERHITYVEDDRIREVALGGPDTATRGKLVCQVKVTAVCSQAGVTGTIPGTVTGSITDPSGAAVANATVTLTNTSTGQASTTTTGADGRYSFASVAPGQYTLGVTAASHRDLQESITVTGDQNTPYVFSFNMPLGDSGGDVITVQPCCTTQQLTAQFQPSNRGRLRARAKQASVSTDPCIVSPQARYRGPENQLYRVEVHTGSHDKNGNATTPTFKWSRENGSVVFPIVKVTPGGSATTVVLENLGRDDRFGLVRGEWVEIQDDTYVLQNRAEPLLQVQSIDRPNLTATLTGAPASNVGQVAGQHALLRRWDQESGDPAEGGLTLSSTDNAALIEEDGNWYELENGVQIQFQAPDAGQPANAYRTGDYWLIPARTATGDVEWPNATDAQGNPLVDGQGADIPIALPPLGVQHYYAPLAVLTLDAKTGNVTDCRRVLNP